MLLKPNKNADPDLTIMATSTFLLKELKQNQFEKISELRLALMENNKNAVALLEPSLELLFILGLVEYHPKNDLIEYTGS
ncbi:ABC-three component system middle component 8 [Cronobacter turicensis]|uniref:ABC-three component system middle component 8 n=1 Tax=Cronobacter turicensis TaxID=413502 RepID=UPI0015880905|nr:ABC-three component system middle component 8 [Cronobacter turicensis]NUW56469.1 hypothetical protein [Cronobacter turicensis]